MHVVGAEQVAHPAVLAVGRAQPLGQLARRPPGAVVGDQLDRSHLVKADDDPVRWALAIQAEHPLGLRLEVGVRAPLPRARALVRESRADQRLTQRLLGEVDPDRGQVHGQLGQRPARQRHALGVGAGARDRDDPVALSGRGLLRTPAPIVRVQRAEPIAR